MQSSMMYLHVKKIGDESVDPVKDLNLPVFHTIFQSKKNSAYFD